MGNHAYYIIKPQWFGRGNFIHFLYEVRYNSGHSFETRTRILAGPFVKYWTLLVS